MSAWMLLVTMTLLLAFLNGCASTRVDFGGVMNPQDVPVDARACDEITWRSVERVRPEFPMDLVRFFYFRQDSSRLTRLTFSFDVDAQGSTRNIRFMAPKEYTSHATLRKAILSSAVALSQWRFEPEGEAFFVTDCSTVIEMEFRRL